MFWRLTRSDERQRSAARSPCMTNNPTTAATQRSSWRRILFQLTFASGIAAAAVVLLAASADTTEAALPFAFPAAAGSQWQIASGYNTATHSVADKNDPYAIDLVRTDAPTDGTQVLSPIDGRVQFADSSCLSVVDANRTTILLCHLFPVPGLRGKTVVRGQWLGTVAPPGQANNNGLSHIHMALSDAARGPMPFTGAYVLEGVPLPATTEANGYSGTSFVSSNTPALAVDAGPDLQVRPATSVTLVATTTGGAGSTISYAWRQTSGAAVTLAKNGASASFTAPAANNSTLVFEVVAVAANAQTATTTVSVRTSTSAVVAAAAGAPGSFIAAPVFSTTGLALAVYNGGSVAQLEATARAAGVSGAWAQDASGIYQLLILNGPTFVNDGFRARFPNGFSTAVALTLVR